MSNENTVTVQPVKLTLNQKSQSRVLYEQSQLLSKRARLMKLPAGSPGYKRCQESIEKTERLIADIQSKLNARLARPAAERAAPAANDSEPEVTILVEDVSAA